MENSKAKLHIIERADDLKDLSNALTLANEGIDDSLVNSLITLVIDKIDQISYSIREEVTGMTDHE